MRGFFYRIVRFNLESYKLNFKIKKNILVKLKKKILKYNNEILKRKMIVSSSQLKHLPYQIIFHEFVSQRKCSKKTWT